MPGTSLQELMRLGGRKADEMSCGIPSCAGAPGWCGGSYWDAAGNRRESHYDFATPERQKAHTKMWAFRLYGTPVASVADCPVSFWPRHCYTGRFL